MENEEDKIDRIKQLGNLWSAPINGLDDEGNEIPDLDPEMVRLEIELQKRAIISNPNHFRSKIRGRF